MSRRFSVVVNTYNRADSLRRTLEGLSHLDHDSFEVVVVNGPSTDGTERLLAEWSGAVKVARTHERNLSVSRNIGIAAASGEVVAFIDDDAYPDPAWLDRLDAAYDDPEVGAAGGPVLDHTGAAWQARYSLANRRGDAWVSDGPNPTALYGSPFTDVFVYTIGTNSSFRREALVGVGGFDEEYEYYLDETDVCLRLVDQGWLIAALDDGVVFHKFLPSDVRTDQRAIKNRYSVVKNRLYFALRHGQHDRSVPELLDDAQAFVEYHRQDIRWNIDHELLTEDDATQYEADARRANDMAVARALSGESRTRPPAWFDQDHEPFLAFPTKRLRQGKLHLVLLSQEYPPAPVNGIGRFVHGLATGLGRRGHVVHVITRSDTHHRVDFEDDVWVHRIVATTHPKPRGIDLPDHIWDHAASAADELRRIDQRRPVDVVQFPNWDVEGIAIALEQEHLTVLSLHTPLRKVVELDATFPADNPDIRRIGEAERDLYGRTSGYLANSTSVIDEIERAYDVTLTPDAVTLVAHGLPAARTVDPVAPIGPVDDCVEVLYVGRLEHRKGIDTLLAAAPKVLEAHPGAVLTIVGDDQLPTPRGTTYRQEFEQSVDAARLGDRVRFLGRVDDDELERCYAHCDVFVAPSRYESFGLILLEAMRHAKPVVAADVGGMRGIVEPGVSGELVPPGDPDALASALDGLLADPDRRTRLGTRGLAVFEERFSQDAMVEGVERMYRALLAAPLRHEAGDQRRLGIDLAPLTRCAVCHGPLREQPSVVTADGLTKRGHLVCDACAETAATIEQFTYDFHARGPAPAPADAPLVVPVLGERRLDAAALAGWSEGRWFIHDRFVVADGAAPGGLEVSVRCTDAMVRLLHHRFSGIVELVVDGEVVQEVDLFLAEGALVHAYPLVTDAPYGHHTIEIRPTGRANPAADGRQILVEEVVLFGPIRPGLGFQLPEPVNRGNPASPDILRYLDQVPDDAWILECGGGDRRDRRPRHVNFEYLGFELADAFGDLHHLPFVDDAFDFVFSQAVFEHVRNPFEAANELIRVTKPGGLIVTEVAFLQPLHAVPFHFFNMTQWGTEELFSSCEIVESDWIGTLSESIDWILRSANLDGDAPAATMAAVRRHLAELDQYVSHDDLKAVASGVYVVARKPAQA